MFFKNTKDTKTMMFTQTSAFNQFQQPAQTNTNTQGMKLASLGDVFKPSCTPQSQYCFEGHMDPKDISVPALSPQPIPISQKSDKHFQLFMDLEMEYNKEHLLKPLLKLNTGLNGEAQLSDTLGMKPEGNPLAVNPGLRTYTKKSTKGRKRNPANSAKSIYDLIHDSVIPKWKRCLKSKADRRSANTPKARSDTVWKKMLRDVREFYRLLFRARFHYLEYQNQQGAMACIKLLFEELNIPLQLDDEQLHIVFRYLHQSHKTRFMADAAQESDSDQIVALDVIEKYNEHYRSCYMKDDFGARLLYFVFKNFLHEYCLLIKPRYRKEITIKVCMILNCYRRMKKAEDLDKIHHHLN